MDRFEPDDIERYADAIDEATAREQRRVAEGIARAQSQPLAKGTTGDCSFCGEYSERLVNGECARCRDLPARNLFWPRREDGVLGIFKTGVV